MGKNKAEQTQRTSHPPVISVLGHVDHGKTTLLDAIRKTNITSREAGGITQSIGASSIQIEHEGQKRLVTLIDTPGHEAFSNMRSHGVSAADIILLVIAADDGIKPQTRESIDIIHKSGAPYIVVITKSDAPGANVEKVKQEVLKAGIMLEGLGGDVPYLSVSAKTNQNIQELLDLILIVYDISGFKKDENTSFLGVVIESQLDKRRGAVSTVIVKSGMIKFSSKLYVNEEEVGKVRALFDTTLKSVPQAYPGDAVEILGINKVLPAGSVLTDLPVKKEAIRDTSVISKQDAHQDLLRRIHEQGKEKLPLIVKTRTSGEYEAIVASLPEDVSVVFEGRGDISVSDIMMANDFQAIVVGFNVKIEKQAEVLAQSQGIFYRTYSIIYKMLEEIQDAQMLLSERKIKRIAGKAKILASFEGTKGTIIGLRVDEGRIQVGDKILKDEESDAIASVLTIKQGKDDVKQVGKGNECGITTDPDIDFTIGDMLLFVAQKKTGN